MSHSRFVVARSGSRKAVQAPAATPVHPLLALQRSIGNGAVARLLQRAPGTRVTAHETRTGGRITGKPAEIATKFRDLREKHRADAIEVLKGLRFEHLWGGSKSDVTNSDEEFSVRIDRQNPTPTHSNIQIQTNGKTSISLGTVLLSDTLATTKDRAAVVNAVKQAFRMSLGDGMQWEVYDAPEAEKVQAGKGKGASPDRGDKGKRGKGPGKGGGGAGKRGRQVAVQ
jgi:hypothetical protein